MHTHSPQFATKQVLLFHRITGGGLEFNAFCLSKTGYYQAFTDFGLTNLNAPSVFYKRQFQFVLFPIGEMFMAEMSLTNSNNQMKHQKLTLQELSDLSSENQMASTKKVSTLNSFLKGSVTYIKRDCGVNGE